MSALRTVLRAPKKTKDPAEPCPDKNNASDSGAKNKTTKGKKKSPKGKK